MEMVTPSPGLTGIALADDGATDDLVHTAPDDCPAAEYDGKCLTSDMGPMATPTTSQRNHIALEANDHDSSRDGLGSQYRTSDNSSTEEDVEKHQTLDSDFEVRWDGEHDPTNPKNMHIVRRWLIVLIVSSCSFSV